MNSLPATGSRPNLLSQSPQYADDQEHGFYLRISILPTLIGVPTTSDFVPVLRSQNAGTED